MGLKQGWMTLTLILPALNSLSLRVPLSLYSQAQAPLSLIYSYLPRLSSTLTFLFPCLLLEQSLKKGIPLQTSKQLLVLEMQRNCSDVARICLGIRNLAGLYVAFAFYLRVVVLGLICILAVKMKRSIWLSLLYRKHGTKYDRQEEVSLA